MLWSLHCLLDALVERDELDSADAALTAAGLGTPPAGWLPAPLVLQSRARLRLAQQRPADAHTDLLDAAGRWRELGVHQAILASWRPRPPTPSSASTSPRRPAGSPASNSSSPNASASPAHAALRCTHLPAARQRRNDSACSSRPPTSSPTRRPGSSTPARSSTSAPRCAAPTTAPKRVATLAAHGHSNREIAEQLYITQRTVETHLTHAFQKLHITNRTQLAARITPDEAPDPASQRAAAQARPATPDHGTPGTALV